MHISEEEKCDKHAEFCEEVGTLVDVEEVRGLSRLESGRSLVAVGIAIIHNEKGESVKLTLAEIKELLDDWREFNKNS